MVNSVNDIANNAGEVAGSLISSGFGQSVVIIVIVGVILYFVLKVFNSSNNNVTNILDKLLKSNDVDDDSLDVQSRIRQMEKESSDRGNRLSELEKLPAQVEILSEVIKEVKKIVDDEA